MVWKLLSTFAIGYKSYTMMMKNTLMKFLLALATFSLTGLTQGKAQNKDAAKLDSLASQLFAQKDFAKSLEMRTLQLEKLRTTVGEKDSTYNLTLLQKGKCYYRLKQYDDAVATAKKVCELYAANFSDHNSQYAFRLDNLALYQSAAQQYKEGLANVEKALTIYGQLQRNNADMSVILLHAAELSHFCGDNATAIARELLALNIIRRENGEHSDEYIDEADYLRQYYEANGDKDKAEALQTRLETLKEETDKGIVDLPPIIDFKSPEVAHEHNKDASRCIEYYLNHYVRASKMSEAATYIIRWSEASADCHIAIGENEAKMETKQESLPYYVAYMASCSRYALKTGKSEFTLDTFEDAMEDVLNFYIANKQYTGEVKYLEKYLEVYKKDSKSLKVLLKKNFPGKLTEEMVNRVKNGEKVKVEK